MLFGHSGEGKNRNVSRSFDGCGYFPLVTGTVAGYPSWNDLPSLGDIVSENLVVFVIDDNTFVCAEAADLSSWERSSSISISWRYHLFLLRFLEPEFSQGITFFKGHTFSARTSSFLLFCPSNVFQLRV